MALFKSLSILTLRYNVFRFSALSISTRKVSKLSYDHRVSDTPLRYETYCDVLDRAVEKFPDRPAITSFHQRITKTFHEFHNDVTSLAAGIVSLGLSKGTKVAVLSPNNYEWIASQYALAYAGLVMTTINPALTEPEICYAINKSKSEAVIIAECYKTTNYINLMKNIIPNLDDFDNAHIRSEKLPSLKHIITMQPTVSKSTFSLNELSNRGGEKEYKVKLEKIRKYIQPDDPVNIQFTSGTTGKPKGVVLSHYSLINNADCCVKAFKLTEKDSICLPVPLFHCFGCVLGTTAMALSCSKIVLPSSTYSPKEVLEAIDQEKCTVLYGSPTMFTDFVNHPDFKKYHYSSLRGGIMAASICPMKLLKTIHDDMNMKDVCVAYGTTENSPLITMTDINDSLDIRCSTVGRTLGHIETKVIDSEGRIVKRGEKGELCARGFQVMLEYFEDDEKTKETLRKDRWYRTGDLATMDDDGYIRIVGRIKDMIIRGGENIYPSEIEEFLLTHPSIAEVQVFGVPDDRLGEIVCAWIKLKPDQNLSETAVKNFCSGKLAKFKIPIHIRFVNTFPKVESGKIKKNDMTEAMMKELKL
ncbi:Acyl-CoA synthetase family member 2, mitochondrial [Nymphon striatum]|nr:Acyl-CoA synthetase family member 2, mitochondrial [Nymphon striatum]